MEKIRIRKKIESFDGDILIGKIESVIDNLKKESEKLSKEGWTDITIEEENHYEYHETVAFGINIESDQEFNDRKKKIEMEIEKTRKKIEKEKEQYEILRRKYEGESQRQK